MRTYEVRHRTRYRYDQQVTASYGRAYLTPRDAPGQVCRSTRLDIEPGPETVIMITWSPITALRRTWPCLSALREVYGMTETDLYLGSWRQTGPTPPSNAKPVEGQGIHGFTWTRFVPPGEVDVYVRGAMVESIDSAVEKPTAVQAMVACDTLTLNASHSAVVRDEEFTRMFKAIGLRS